MLLIQLITCYQNFCSPLMPFFWSRQYPGIPHCISSCSLVSLKPGQFFSLSLFSMAPTLKSITAQIFCSLNFVMFSHNQIEVIHFWQGHYLRGDDIISGSMMSMRYLTGDVNFDHLVNVVSSMFLHQKDTLFIFVINKWRIFLILKISRRFLFNQ